MIFCQFISRSSKAFQHRIVSEHLQKKQLIYIVNFRDSGGPSNVIQYMIEGNMNELRHDNMIENYMLML